MVFHSKYPDLKIPEVTVHQELFSKWKKYGERKALICGETDRSYTYIQLEALCKCIASGLVKLGIKKGTIVAIFLPNMPEYALCLFGIISAGGAATTINPGYTAYELGNQLGNSDAYAIITLKGLEETLEKALQNSPNNIKHKVLLGGSAPGYIPFTKLLTDDGSAYPSQMTFDVKNDVAIIPYSSGTTGLPKGVMLTHYNMVANMYQNGYIALQDNTIKRFDDKLSENMLCIIPMFHLYGLFNLTTLGLRYGFTVVTLSKFVPEVYLKAIEKYKITILLIVPPLVVFMAKSPLVKNYDFSSIKSVSSGAAPLSSDTTKEFLSRVPVKSMGQAYGMTETSPTVTSSIASHHIPGASGVIVPNTQLKIVDLSTGKDLGEGERGEIWVKGPQVMKGYYKNPKATADTIDKDGWIHTGDVGYMKNDQLYIVDRIKELIKYKAFQVAPAELEALLLNYPGVSDAAVIGIPDPEAGELPRAYIVVKEGQKLTEQEIHKFVNENTVSYKHLRGGIAFVQSIPKTVSGKIMRKELKNQYSRSKL